AREGLRQLLDDKQDPKIYGILASAEKRMAEIYWRISGPEKGGNWSPTEDLDLRDMLMSASKHYTQAFERDRSQIWALVQVLALSAVVRRWNEDAPLSVRRWQLAKTFSEEELALGN